jgi:hypothetical protein
MLDTLKQKVQSLATIKTKASGGILESRKIEKPDPATVLAGMNRKYRREFKRVNGIFLRGSTKPVVNAPMGKVSA